MKKVDKVRILHRPHVIAEQSDYSHTGMAWRCDICGEFYLRQNECHDHTKTHLSDDDDLPAADNAPLSKRAVTKTKNDLVALLKELED